MRTQKHPRRTSAFLVWPACVVCFVVFYLGSFGPFCWLIEHSVISEATGERMMGTVYYPLVLLNEETDLLHTVPGELYLDYINWWAPNL